MLSANKILVTGGGGFLGKAIVLRLIEQGCLVRSLCRRKYRTLSDLNVEQVQGDICDPELVEKACRGVDLIFHTAAKAGIWGDTSEFYDINVLGTKNILAAAAQSGNIPLIHTSSPSVVFNGHDMAGVDESVPYPLRFTADYPATKAQAEQLVTQAAGEGLPAIILRPHLIWGPGDNHLVPRILKRAHQLRRVGNGRNMVDTTYIDNAADAHILASRCLLSNPKLSGKKYFISQGEPVRLWGMVNDILKAAGKTPVQGHISRRTALIAGTLLEVIYKVFRLSGEPRMTRFLAEELSTDHWFDLRAAQKDIGYIPSVSIAQGLKKLSEWFRTTSDSQ